MRRTLVKLNNSTIGAFRSVVRQRRSVRSFDKEKAISAEMLHDILEDAQRSPSSFNLQPYCGIIVTEEAQKAKVADAMMGTNPQRVRDAPVTVVLLADKEPTRRVPHLMALERAAGKPTAYIESLPAKTSFLAGPGMLAKKLKWAASELLSPVVAAPRLEMLECWSTKNCAFFAQTLMLAAAARGVDSCPMEGFDARRLAWALNFPLERYGVPLVVALGYVGAEDEDILPSPRFPTADMFHAQRYGTRYEP